MGVCCGNEKKNVRRSRNTETSKKNNLKKTDPNSSNNLEININEREKILKRGITHELKNLIDNFDEDINSYVFGQNKTLLIEACIVCPNSEVIDLIMEKGANIDCQEYQTGNTPIFITSLDLKVDFVQKILLLIYHIFYKVFLLLQQINHLVNILFHNELIHPLT